MLVETRSAEGVRVVRVRALKVLSESSIRELGEGLDAVVESGGSPLRLVIDLSGVEFLSSAALAKLVLTKRRLMKSGGDLSLCRLSSQLARTFRITNLWHYFPIHASPQEALEACGWSGNIDAS
jgi:anti-anti-sigma factor